jgi:hypothetical protein
LHLLRHYFKIYYDKEHNFSLAMSGRLARTERSPAAVHAASVSLQIRYIKQAIRRVGDGKVKAVDMTEAF